MKAVSLFLLVLLVLHTSLPAGPTPAQKAVHSISIGELRDQVSARNAERASNIREVQTLLRHQGVQDRLGHLFDLEKAALAVPTLDDETLAKLARESEQMNEQFRAGLGTGIIVLIAVGVAVAVVLIILMTAEAEVTSVSIS